MKKATNIQLPSEFNKHQKVVLTLCILLLLPALLINLGLLALIEDEAIRGLVALEMWYSGDYIAPTINGQPYYNKPPLYNWIILLSYTIWGQVSEFSLRFPTVVFTLIYGYLVYHLYKGELGKMAAICIALLTVTCGRIFFYDSFLGLIDMCFSMCMFSLMIGSYKLAKEKKWKTMFLFAYGLAAIGFLLKTLPAIVFLGISLIVILIAEKSFKQFFTLAHAIGVALALAIVGAYYITFSLEHDIIALGTRMISESSTRTVVKFGIWKTVQHFFTFPFEFIFHFLPWTILIIYLFRKGALTAIWRHPFLRMNILLLSANILLYWTSPQVYARYLLMFPPLMFAPLYYLHQINKTENSLCFKFVKYVLYLLIAVIIVGCVAPIFVERISFIKHLYIKSSFLAVLAALGLYLIWKAKQFDFLHIFLFVIIFRIGFNWFVFPDRNANDYSNIIRVSATEVGQRHSDKPLAASNKIGLNRSVSFYLTKERKKQVLIVDSPPKDGLLLSHFLEENCKKIDNIKSRTPSNDYLVLECKD